MESLNIDLLQAMADEQDTVMVDRSCRTPSPTPMAGKKHGLSPTHTPVQNILTSPKRSAAAKRRMSAHDRFIPDRSKHDNFQTAYRLNTESLFSPAKTKSQSVEIDAQKELDRIYSEVLKSEMFGPSYVDTQNNSSNIIPTTPKAHNSAINSNSSGISKLQASSPKKKILQFPPLNERRSVVRKLQFDPFSPAYSVSPVNKTSQKTLQSPRKPPRNISKVPFKILDAPDLADDFYLNVVDWGQDNMLGVGLNTSVYLWNACTSRVTKLCDLAPYDTVASLQWAQKGCQLAIGTSRGEIQLWDVRKQKNIRTLGGHSARVGALAWNDNILSTGSRDRTILHRDIRTSDHYVKRLLGHRQEVCGLKWSIDNQLASGGNDNRLMIWDKMETNPLYKFAEHKAAVKAISWSPHQHGLLVSGGGTADRKIRFWNTLTGTPLQCIDTGSQVCNIQWSKNSNEFVSTHGYSQNQIVVWKYPTLQQLAVLTGHTYRVLYLAMSPDGQTVVTGAGDETLRFWNVFNKRKESNSVESVLTSARSIR